MTDDDRDDPLAERLRDLGRDVKAPPGWQQRVWGEIDGVSRADGPIGGTTSMNSRGEVDAEPSGPGLPWARLWIPLAVAAAVAVAVAGYLMVPEAPQNRRGVFTGRGADLRAMDAAAPDAGAPDAAAPDAALPLTQYLDAIERLTGAGDWDGIRPIIDEARADDAIDRAVLGRHLREDPRFEALRAAPVWGTLPLD